REQHVEERVEADADHVAVARHDRQERRRDGEREVEAGARNALELAAHDADEAAAEVAPGLVGGDPLVDPDARRRRLLGPSRDGRDVGSASGHPQTFCTAARPSRPLGRSTITAISTANTIASLKVDEM